MGGELVADGGELGRHRSGHGVRERGRLCAGTAKRGHQQALQ